MESELKTMLEDPKGPLVFQCNARAPYSGCWNEPNYWLLKDQKIYPLYISGEAWDRFEFSKHEPPWMHGIHFMSFMHAMEEMGDLYDEWELIYPDEWDLDNYNVLNAITVLLMVHQVELPKWTCSICGGTCRGRAKFLGYRGNGGIGVLLENPCCSDCFYEIKWCERCGYVKADEVCPNKEDEEGHELHDPSDEAEKFGLTGTRFLGPGGDAEGLEGVSIMTMQKEE